VRARLALAVINPEIVLEISEGAIGAPMIAQRGSTGLDRIHQHGLDGFDQPFGPLVRSAVPGGDCRGLTLGRKTRAEQGFADIDIAKSCHNTLIAERRLQRRLLAGARFRQHRRIEFITKRFRTKPFQQRLMLETVWEAAPDIQTRTVDMHVQRLRTKLGDAGDLVETVRGFGYRLKSGQSRSA